MFSIPFQIRYNTIITINNAIGSHIGEVTHHQDHCTTFANFKTRKIKNSVVPNPEAPAAFDLLSVIVYFYLYLKLSYSFEYYKFCSKEYFLNSGTICTFIVFNILTIDEFNPLNLIY